MKKYGYVRVTKKSLKAYNTGFEASYQLVRATGLEPARAKH